MHNTHGSMSYYNYSIHCSNFEVAHSSYRPPPYKAANSNTPSGQLEHRLGETKLSLLIPWGTIRTKNISHHVKFIVSLPDPSYSPLCSVLQRQTHTHEILQRKLEAEDALTKLCVILGTLNATVTPAGILVRRSPIKAFSVSQNLNYSSV